MTDALKTYRANAEGFDGDKIREEGEVFTTGIPQGSWMDLLDEKGNVVDRPRHTPAPTKGKADKSGSDDSAAVDFHKELAARDADIAALRAEIDKLKAGGQPNPGPLDGSLPELTAYLESVSDVGAIDALIEAEKAGKTRVGALAALDARKTALQGN